MHFNSIILVILICLLLITRGGVVFATGEEGAYGADSPSACTAKVGSDHDGGGDNDVVVVPDQPPERTTTTQRTPRVVGDGGDDDAPMSRST